MRAVFITFALMTPLFFTACGGFNLPPAQVGNTPTAPNDEPPVVAAVVPIDEQVNPTITYHGNSN